MRRISSPPNTRRKPSKCTFVRTRTAPKDFEMLFKSHERAKLRRLAKNNAAINIVSSAVLLGCRFHRLSFIGVIASFADSSIRLGLNRLERVNDTRNGSYGIQSGIPAPGLGNVRVR